MAARSALLVAALVWPSPQDGGTVVTRAAEAPTRNAVTVYDDGEFRFLYRHFGDQRDPGGTTEPGLFVHSRSADRWIQILAISTAHGRFGRSSVDDSTARPPLARAAVGWDFGYLAALPYADQPLRTSGSIAFPDSIRFDDSTRLYELRYLTSWGIPEAETVLYVKRSDLAAAFGRDRDGR